MDYFVKIIKNYANFKGRASRKEYWMAYLFASIYYLIAITLDNSLGMGGVLPNLYGLLLLLPMLAVGARRLHDIGYSGNNMFVGLIPIAS